MKKRLLFFYVITAISLIFFNGCEDSPVENKMSIPEIETIDAIGISHYSATSGGILLSNGGDIITERGVCWSTNENPTLGDNAATRETDEERYYVNIKHLVAGSQYFVRAYAINSVGIGYGNNSTFTTPIISTSNVYTLDISDVTDSSAICGGNISSDGGSTVTERGVCWSTSQTPTVDDNKTSDGTGTGNYVSNISGLTANTTYYVRAYATNNVGTGYGSTKSFLTHIIPSLTTNYITQVSGSSSSAICGGNISSDGGSTVTERGVCWSISQTPTVDDNKTSDGTGTGNYVSNISGLTANTTYYVRAYATNNVGTGYGETRSFTPIESSTVTDIDGNTYPTIRIDDNWWMTKNLIVTHYNNGDSIPEISDNTEWGNSNGGAYCIPYNNQIHIDPYGMLYNWYAVSDARNIAPEGWHVPSYDELQEIVNYYGGASVAGNSMGNYFSRVEAGYRNANGNFWDWTTSAYYWSSTETGNTNAWHMILNWGNSRVLFSYMKNKNHGLSIRCVKD